MRVFALFASLLFLLCGLSAAAAQDAPAIAARAGEHPDFDRVVFDWPHPVTYEVARDGDKVTLHFDAPATTRFGGDFAYLTRAHGFSAAADANGNLVVTFVIDPQMALKDFVSDKSIVVDIRKPSGNAVKTAAASPAKAVPKAAAKEAPVPAAQPVTPVQSETSATDAAQQTDAGSGAIELHGPPPSENSSAAATSAQTPAAAPPPPRALSAQANKALTALAADLTATPLLVASLDPHTDIRAAIFIRAGYGYIVFDRKLTLSPDALTAGQQAPRVTLEPLELPKNSGFRFPVPDNAEMTATHTGTVWQVFLVKEQSDVPVSTSLIAQPDFALGARYLLPLPDAPEPIRFTDPVVGDDLILVPLGQNEAFSIGRDMADFRIWPAAQGLVLKPLNEKLIVRSVSDGIEITADGGLHLSSSTDTGSSQQSTQKAKAAAAGKSIFDFSGWRGKPSETYTEARQRLQQTIVDVPEAELNRARLELARFYFAYGDGEEASGLLLYLAQQVPDLMAHADFLALLGASKIIAYHPEEGLKYLDTPLLARQPEIELWQAAGNAELRIWQVAEEIFSGAEQILAGYPEPFYSRFMLLAIESALAVNKDHEAADWLDRLENGPHGDLDSAIDYLHGVLHAKAGRAVAAEQAWKDAAAGHDRLYKIRAELALIDLGVSNGSLTPAQAADRLEALRFGWRGDDLEVDILHRLGQFYIEANNVKAGLNTLDKAVQLYPNSPLVPQIKEEMAQIFHDVFLGDLGKNLSPLDALTLYQQFRNLMPGGADGIAVTKNLAERLVAIDLLDQAADLLQDLVQNKLQGVDKSRTGTRLAAIRLLDHKPDAALEALDTSNTDGLPADLVNERTLLRAKALADMKRDDDALALLHDNNTQAAKLLRADITMHAQRWPDAAKALEDLIGSPPKAGESIDPDKAQWLVNCAIALSLAGDQTGLDRLAIDYGAAMAGTPQNDTFRVLTQADKSGDMHDIAGVQSQISDVDMFQGFLNNYRKADESPAAPAKK